MSKDADRIDEVVAGVDDLKTTVEELDEDPNTGADPKALEDLKHALDRAKNATEKLEDDLEGQ